MTTTPIDLDALERHCKTGYTISATIEMCEESERVMLGAVPALIAHARELRAENARLVAENAELREADRRRSK